MVLCVLSSVVLLRWVTSYCVALGFLYADLPCVVFGDVCCDALCVLSSVVLLWVTSCCVAVCSLYADYPYVIFGFK